MQTPQPLSAIALRGYSEHMKSLPYADVRILDFTIAQQGPIATQMLADFGADVIKVERPAGGDLFRGSSESGCLYAHSGGYGPAFIACNRNKRSITLDLKNPRARDLLYQMALTTDVVVANFRPGVMEKLGLGYEDLSAIQPRIICAYGTGYGLSGPDRDTLGQDMMAQCRAGLVRGHPPKTAGYNVVDQMGGTLLAMGIMVALAAREKTGRGQVVDSNLLNAALYTDTPGAVSYLNQRPPVRPRPRLPNPTYALYQTRDQRWVHIIDAFRDRPLQRQCAALGIPESFANEERFANVHDLSPEAHAELSGRLASAIAELTADEVVERFRKQDMMAVPVQDFAQVFDDPQVLHNGMVQEVEHPESGKLRLLGCPIRLSDTPASIRFAPPRLGEHNGEILREMLGLTDEQVDHLRSEGVMG